MLSFVKRMDGIFKFLQYNTSKLEYLKENAHDKMIDVHIIINMSFLNGISSYISMIQHVLIDGIWGAH